MHLLSVGLTAGLLLAQVPRPDPAVFRAQAARGLPLVRAMATDAAVVSAVVAQNERHLSMAAIRNAEKEWTATPGLNSFVKKHLESPCARALKAAAERHPAMVEAFAMDARGALVCSISKTSDYWQGDEAKWRRSFAGGAGGELVEGPLFDESSQRYSVQISVAVRDGASVVGALTVGLSLERLEPRSEPKPSRPDAGPGAGASPDTQPTP